MPNSTAYLHPEFSARCQDWGKTLQHLLDEVDRLDLIYVNQADEGQNELFTDVEFATIAELTECVACMRELRSFMTNGAVSQGWRTQKIAAMLQ